MHRLPSDFSTTQHKVNKPVNFIKLYSNKSKVIKEQVLLESNLISFVLEGEKSISLPNNTIKVAKDSFLILKNSKCLMTEKSSLEGQFRSILFFFDFDFLKQFFIKHNLVSNYHSSSSKNFNVLKKDNIISSIIDSLIPYFDNPNSLSQSLYLLKIEELLLQIINKHGLNAITFLLNPTASNFKVQQVVEQNVLNNLSSEELAFLCHMSESTFRRNFIKIYNSPPKKWFLLKRLEAAKNLLNKGQSASEVASIIGFETFSGFINSFKKQYGITPKKYQMKMTV